MHSNESAAKSRILKNLVFLFKPLFSFSHFTSCFFVTVVTAFAVWGQAKPPVPNIGTEIAEVKIEVKKPTSPISNDKKSSTPVSYKTLPISEVPILEGDEKLVIKFCGDCKSRKFEDLGFRKMLVFFVNPASVYADFDKNFDKAFKEIEFDFKSKKKKQAAQEYAFDVPYRSIPLVFLVSNGDYKADLRKVILEKQADVIKLGEQSNLLAELPQTFQYLSKVKEVLSAPGTLNNSVAESLVQRAQFFNLNNTNCFQQPLATDQEKLSCLSRTFNAAEFQKDLSSLNFDKYGKLVGQEAVSQIRNKYAGMNLFFDATVTVIELVGTMFKKRPLNIQISALDTTKTSPEGFVSLRQIPVNMQANTERALLIAPLKWREKDAVPTTEMLKTVALVPARTCLQPGSNSFKVETANALIKQEIKRVSLNLTDKDKPNQTQEFANLAVNPADGTVAVTLDEKLWQKMKNWEKISAKARFDYNFETIEKEFDLNILPEAKWQIVKTSDAPIRKSSQDFTLRITPNTVKRECLDKIVVMDQNNQKIEFLPQKGFNVEPNGIVQINLSAPIREKLQSGKINLDVYEAGAEKPTGQLSLNLFNKQPQYKVSAYLNDLSGEIRGERLNEIKAVSINGQAATLESIAAPDAKANELNKLKFVRGISTPTANVSITLAAGDVINQTINLLPPRPRITGKLDCAPSENQSRIIINKKVAYQAYELENCVYPTDTDEIKLIVISDGDNYAYSTVNKPAVNIGFLRGDYQPNSFAGSVPQPAVVKPQTVTVTTTVSSPTGNYVVTAPSSVMSPRRLDVTLKIDQKIREQLDDGSRMFLRITDPVRGESDWQPVEIKFLRLPTNLALNCTSEVSPVSESPTTATVPQIANAENAPNPAIQATSNIEAVNQKCELSGNLSMIEKILVPDGQANKTEKAVGLTSDKISFSKKSNEKLLYLKLRGYEPNIKVNLTELANQPLPISKQ